MLNFESFLTESRGNPRDFFGAKNFKELYVAICKITDEDDKISQMLDSSDKTVSTSSIYILNVPRYIPNANLTHSKVSIRYEIVKRNQNEYYFRDFYRSWSNVGFEFLKIKVSEAFERDGVFDRYEMRHLKSKRGKKSAYSSGII
jgi:bifunctional N-acetylglucosamine-1-phosphate-uridyltransferase/glucosamine-1-phosphate-acetyltransferase GlmU-like protein